MCSNTCDGQQNTERLFAMASRKMLGCKEGELSSVISVKTDILLLNGFVVETLVPPGVESQSLTLTTSF